MKKILVLCALALSLSASRLLALGVEVAADLAPITPMGSLAYKGDITLDLQNDLKYDKLNVYSGRIRAELPGPLPNLYLQAAPMKFDGTGSKNVAFTYGDQTFNANVPFTSSLKLDQYDLAFFYGIPFLNTATMGKVKIDLGLNVRLLDFKAEINQPASGLSQSKAQALPIPMGYLGLRLQPVEFLGIDGEARAIAYGGDSYYDFVGRARVKVFGPLYVAGGYKVQTIRIAEQSIRADMTFGGPFGEVGVSF